MEYYSQYLKLYKRFIDDVFAIWRGPKGTLLEFLNALNSKTDRIKLAYCNLAKVASLFWICFSIEISLRTCCNFPPFKSLLTNICTYHSSLFHSYSNKKVFIKGELVRYVRNSSSFDSFYETREKFWKRLHVRG